MSAAVRCAPLCKANPPGKLSSKRELFRSGCYWKLRLDYDYLLESNAIIVITNTSPKPIIIHVGTNSRSASARYDWR